MIKAKELTYSYTGLPPFVLDHVDFTAKDGEYISVVGENGCGKSTLMRLILKFLKPSGGEIVNTAKRIGYVPQKSSVLNDDFPITVFEALDSYRRLLKIKDRHEVKKSLQKVKMTDFLKRRMCDLSGGQEQKIRIARALMGEPDLLVLDEPSTGIDVQSQCEIYALMKKLNTENHMTIISVEHNLQAALKNSTVIYHIAEGRGHRCTPEKYAAEFMQENSAEGSGKNV